MVGLPGVEEYSWKSGESPRKGSPETVLSGRAGEARVREKAAEQREGVAGNPRAPATDSAGRGHWGGLEGEERLLGWCGAREGSGHGYI
jgi:hypothetical protein